MSGEDEFRMVNLSRAQRDWLERNPYGGSAIAAAWDKAPEDAWGEIADEFRRHRCRDGNCFAETVLMRLGAISYAGTFDWPRADPAPPTENT